MCDALLPPQLFLTHSQSLRGESHRYGSGHGRGTLGSIERHSRAYQGHVSERAVRPNGILVEALPTGRIALGVSRVQLLEQSVAQAAIECLDEGVLR